jgi:hypothetical protein
LAQGGGSIGLNASDSIVTNFSTSPGAWATGSGASITLNGTSVTNNGGGDILRADSSGASITAGNAHLTGKGGGGPGLVRASGGGQITLNGGDVKDTSMDALTRFLSAAGTGSFIDASQGFTINMISGNTQYGVSADSGGRVRLDTVNITGNGSGSLGIASGSNGALVEANKVHIELTGVDSWLGVYAAIGGKIVVTGDSAEYSTIETQGDQGFGIHAPNYYDGVAMTVARPEVDAAYTHVTTKGASGHGAYAYNGGIVRLTNVTVDTSGPTARGLVSDGDPAAAPPPIPPTLLYGTDIAVHTVGASAEGLKVSVAGTADIRSTPAGGSSILVEGPTATGVSVSNSGSVATLADTPVTSVKYDAGLVASSSELHVTGSIWQGGRYGIRSTRRFQYRDLRRRFAHVRPGRAARRRHCRKHHAHEHAGDGQQRLVDPVACQRHCSERGQPLGVGFDPHDRRCLQRFHQHAQRGARQPFHMVDDWQFRRDHHHECRCNRVRRAGGRYLQDVDDE